MDAPTPSLRRRLAERIRAEGPLPFRDVMDAALYDPAGGFYARGQRLGIGGAFSTAPTRHPRFAAAVAAEAREAWTALGRPREFRLVEAGPGDGTMAAELAERLRGVVSELVLLERAAGMRAVQEAALAGAPVPVRWVAEPRELAPADGFVVANELLDALAVHLLDWPAEVWVDVEAGGRLREVPREPADPGLLEAVTARGDVRPRRGARYAVCPEAPGLLLALAGTLSRGRVLVLDYGDEGAAVHRGHDPIRTYLGGMPGGDPLVSVGVQDLTADVDFGALRAAVATAPDLAELRYGDQAEWLAERAGTAAGDLEAALVERILAGLTFKALLVERAVPAAPGSRAS